MARWSAIKSPYVSGGPAVTLVLFGHFVRVTTVLHASASWRRSAEIQPWAEALYRQRKQDFNKDSMETRCLPVGPPYSSTTDAALSRTGGTIAGIEAANLDLYTKILTLLASL